MHQAESSSSLFCLWTGLLLPVALHPASRRRSYLPLRTGQCSRPIGTSTLFVGAYSQAHSSIAFRALTPAASFRGSLCFASLSAQKYGKPYFSARKRTSKYSRSCSPSLAELLPL